MPHDPFDRSERPRWTAAARPSPRARADRVLVLCSCGVDMEFAWTTREPVSCFGCGRAFEPPSHVGRPRLEWWPDRARKPAPARAEPEARWHVLAAAGAIALTLGSLLGVGLWLVAATGRHP